MLEGVSLLLLLIPKILEWAAIDAPAFDRGGAGLAAANIVPVSYTHLDVYKRQPLSWSVPLS